MTLLAVALAAIAAALLTTPVGRPPGAGVTSWPSASPLPGAVGAAGDEDLSRAGRSHRAVLCAGAALMAWTVTSSGLTGTQLGVVAVAGGSGVAVARSVAASRRADVARRRRRAVVDLCEALVGELRAGQPVLVALERSVTVWPEVAPAVAAARLDADLPEALRRLAGRPGAEALHHLAAAWELCAVTGGGLAAASNQVLDAARADAAALRQVEGEVSSARATARLVAGLPVVVLTAGAGLGARPWGFLLGDPVGVACLATGVALVAAGLAWIDRIATSATSNGG